MNGDFFDLKLAFGEYIGRFYAGLHADTDAMRSFTERGLSRSIVFAPDRMVDQVDKILASYQKNKNNANSDPMVPGKNALFPVMVLAMAKDYTPTMGDFGGRQVGRQMVALADGDGASVYGYRQAMGDVRAQVTILSAERVTANSLAAQFALYVGEIPNRRFRVKHKWGQYELSMPCMLETPDIMFSKVDTDNENMTCLVADVTLRAVFPYLDAPKAGELNDGSTNDPPGYPLVEQFNLLNQTTGHSDVVVVDP